MKRILVATTNVDKVKRIKNLLREYDYEILSLKDINLDKLEEPEETKDNPSEIALEKAVYYAKNINEDLYVLTQDDTLVFEGVKEEDNPGMHIKGPVIRNYGEFTVENAVKYYISLANKYGGEIPVHFIYGHALAYNEEVDGRNVLKTVSATSRLDRILVNEVHNLEKTNGYFLSSLTKTNVNGEWKYSSDLSDDEKLLIDNDIKESVLTLIKKI